MHIGVDATCWQNNRGYGRHARALLSALVRSDPANHYTFCLDSTENLESIPAAAETRIVRASAPTVQSASANGHRSLRDMWSMTRALSSPDFDLVLFPTIYSYVPVVSRAKKLVVIHDVIAERFPHLTQPNTLPRLFWRTKTALGRWQADGLVTVSEYSRQELVRQFGLDPDRIFVVGEAADPAFQVIPNPRVLSRLQALCIKPGDRLLLYVGGFAPHKNLAHLVEVFADLSSQPRFADARLVMVGEYRNEVFHSYFGTLAKRVQELGLAERVSFPGYLSDEDLAVLLNLGSVLVLPSLMEGFGLPAVEAAACGCPVIATSASPLPQLLGEGGIYVDPARPEELKAALISVLDSPERRASMSTAAVKAAGQLTWAAAAEQMRQVIDRVIVA